MTAMVIDIDGEAADLRKVVFAGDIGDAERKAGDQRAAIVPMPPTETTIST